MKNFCLVFFFPYFFAFQISAQTPTIAWTKSFGNSTINWDIKPTADGNFIVLGRIYFDDTVVNCPLKGLGDILITKINTAGDILWQKCYGGSNDEGFGAGDAILPTADLGYIFITKTFSNDGDVSGNHGGDDIWVVKVDSMGAIQWQHCYGGTSSDAPLGIVEAGNQSFIILGLTNSLPGGDIPFRYGGNFDNDVWAARIDDSGNIIWTTVYGGSNSDFIGSISKLNNNQFQLAG
ncbi:MAG: hypothetical protein LH473_12865, partial [Chitinophagales bacterium]|nr:hypothetical protein [Chitinophagales bacterium]